MILIQTSKRTKETGTDANSADPVTPEGGDDKFADSDEQESKDTNTDGNGNSDSDSDLDDEKELDEDSGKSSEGVDLEDKSKIGDAMGRDKKNKGNRSQLFLIEAGCEEYDLPKDRMGDIICMSSQYMTIGSSESSHDLSKLKEPLRSHGGLHEREVPFISNKKIILF